MRQWKQLALAGTLSGLGVVPGEVAMAASDDNTRPKGQWRQADVKRAIGAAQQTGLTKYRIEIGPDGTITIVVGEPPADGGA